MGWVRVVPSSYTRRLYVQVDVSGAWQNRVYKGKLFAEIELLQKVGDAARFWPDVLHVGLSNLLGGLIKTVLYAYLVAFGQICVRNCTVDSTVYEYIYVRAVISNLLRHR